MTSPIPWSRILAEGLVVVLSILLAFGIDAWWDDRSAQQVTRESLAAVREELLGNLELLEEQTVYCARVQEATAGLLSLMGPSPELIPSDSLANLVGGTLNGRVGTRLNTTALEAMVTQGHIALIESVRLRQDLAHWLSTRVDQRIQQRENTRVAIRDAQDYAQTVMPFGRVAARDGSVFGRPHVSRFDLDVARILSDPTLEGAVVRLAAWRGAICGGDSRRRDQVEALISQIDGELSG